MKKIIFQTVATFIFCLNLLSAEGSAKISYQGVLVDDEGILMTGTVDLSFAFYTLQTGGSSFCSLPHEGVNLGTRGGSGIKQSFAKTQKVMLVK